MILERITGLIRKVCTYSTQNAPKSTDWRNKFIHIGEGSEIRQPFLVQPDTNIYIGDKTKILAYSRLQNFYKLNNNPCICIGNRCYICYFFTILNASTVTIGDDVLIASHVLISSENHSIDPESEIPYMHQPLATEPVSIGDGCWIGEKVCILPGVTIGKKCVIGAGSVVTRSIPDYSIAVGKPAKVIKQYNFKTHNWEKV